ncbi:MAG TPA: thiamine-phosphate kinase [Gammaproteobacteria bacterium]|jgi:thiamine-monophosphate kinase|nr:thiamine-phosphate kinase [Gammaproteobacteria bacterium]
MIGEFGIIERYFTRPNRDPDVLIGVGDDAAVIAVRGLAAVTVDTLVAGVHFPDGIAPALLGYRALAVNLSDLAAMGAEPRWCTLALTLPKPDELWLDGFSRGLFELAERHGVSLVGGDLTRGPLTITVQLMGRIDGARMLTRGGGNLGDDVYVTGTLGDSAAGIALINERVDTAPGSAGAALKARFYKPAPRVEAGLALRALASAAIDVSDGLLADLGHICERSGCGALIDVERVPLSAELLSTFPPQIALAHALGGGDDYELCFTAPPSRAEQIDRALEAMGTPATRIGQLVAGQEVVCRRDGEPYTPRALGFRHF